MLCCYPEIWLFVLLNEQELLIPCCVSDVFLLVSTHCPLCSSRSRNRNSDSRPLHLPLIWCYRLAKWGDLGEEEPFSFNQLLTGKSPWSIFAQQLRENCEPVFEQTRLSWNQVKGKSYSVQTYWKIKQVVNCGENENVPTYIYRSGLVLSIIKVFRNLEIHTLNGDSFIFPLQTISEWKRPSYDNTWQHCSEEYSI